MTAPRFELAGAFSPSGPPGPGNPSNPPVLVFTYTANDTLDVQHYLDLGYTRFDVICIGGGGGQGGSLDMSTYDPSNNQWTLLGGAGGGGGIQYVKRGYLRLLPDLPAIVVGSGGAAGPIDVNTSAHAENQANISDGIDGGASSFNGTSCRASGGKGGKKASWTPTSANPNGSSFPTPVTYLNNGGNGGLGGSTVAGGGGAGAIAAQNIESTGNTGVTYVPPVAAVPGTWDPATGIGGGGGGGCGGIGPRNGAMSGAGGAFNAADQSVYSPGSTNNVFATLSTGTGSPNGQGVPGYGGGAKAAPLTGLSTSYGDSQVSNRFPTLQNMPGKAGVVVIRLTAS